MTAGWLRHARGRLAQLADRVPLLLALVLLFAVGFRFAIWLAYHPTVVNITDILRFALMARDQLFYEPGHPGGYPMLLRAIHAVSSDIDLTIVLQHGLGVATGLLLYGTARRIGAPMWAAIVAAAAVLLSFDQIYLEHALMSETLFTLGLVLTLYCCARVLTASGTFLGGRLPTRHGWIVAAGVALGLTTWVRALGEPLVPLMALWIALALPGPWRRRAARAALATAAAAVPILVYFAINQAASGNFGLVPPGSSGWALYARTAEFADCNAFKPPAGTRPLCESTPADERPGPDFYAWEPASPARRLFGYPPLEGEKLSAFALAAIRSQPTDYLAAVTDDFARYFVPGGDDRAFAGTTYDHLEIGRRDPELERVVYETIQSYWADEPLTITGDADLLSDLQAVLRVHPLLMLVATLLGAIGVVLARGRLRAGLLLLLGTALLLLAVPTAVSVYSARYSIPAAGPLIAAGAIGLWLVWERLAGRGTGARDRSPAAA
jgi:Dolichyl-phosphate-mannose-protein mannosyltransferase